MCESIRAFVASAAEAFKLRGPVYRFGTCPTGDLEAAALGDCFPERAYIAFGLDHGAHLDRLPFPDNAARTVLCIGALEHAYQPEGVVGEMMRILSPGGALLVCAPLEVPPAEQMPAYWQLTPRSVGRLLGPLEAALVGWQGADTFPHTIYGVGFKPPATGTIVKGTSRFLERFQARLKEAAGRIGWHNRLKHFLTVWARSRSQRQRRRDYYKLQFTVHLAVDRNLKHDLVQDCLHEEKTGTRLDLMDGDP